MIFAKPFSLFFFRGSVSIDVCLLGPRLLGVCLGISSPCVLLDLRGSGFYAVADVHEHESPAGGMLDLT